MTIEIIAVSWFIAYFEPFQLLLDNAANILYIKSSRSTRNIVNVIHTALGCMKCLAFWFTILSTGDFFLACFNSLIAYTIHLCLRKLN